MFGALEALSAKKIKMRESKLTTPKGDALFFAPCGNRIEGYWYADHCPHFPNPQPNELTQEQANKIHQLILEKEEKAEGRRYRGRSQSRITGETLGTREFVFGGWLWPYDFGRHYVLKHRVKPSKEFLEFIGFVD